MSKKDNKQIKEDPKETEIVNENEKVEVEMQNEVCEIDTLKSELENTKDLLLRTAAEFDNYKKRENANRERMSNFIKGETLKEILPCVDNMHLALQADETSESYAAGVKMSVKGLIEVLEKMGLEQINPIGQEFNANKHLAVMTVEDDTVGENIVTEVLQKGYQIKETVLRPAMVKVANCG